MTPRRRYSNKYSKTPDSLKAEMPFSKEKLPAYRNPSSHGPEKALRCWVSACETNARLQNTAVQNAIRHNPDNI